MDKARNAQVVAEKIEEWRRSDSINEPLAEIALTLARTLDFASGSTVAVISRELRATLAELEPKVNDEPDDTDRWLEQLQAPVGDL